MLIPLSTLTAQVIIKEKVEINPQTVNPEYALPTFTPCGPWITSYDEFNPWQVVWNQIIFAPDPYQQMFNFQDNRVGPGLQRRTYTLDPNKSYNLTIQQSDEYAYFTYGGFYDNSTGSYVPIQYVGSTLSGVSGSDLGAIAWFDYARDFPAGLYYSYSNKYQQRIKRDVPPGTEITVVVFDGQQTINYHTRIETPTFTIESITDEDTLLHYYSRNIDFRLNFQQSSGSCQLDGYGGAYPVGIKFNVEIVQGQEYGNLYYPGTVADPDQSGTSITDIDDEYGIGIANYRIKYKADGVQPDSLTPGIVTIRCSSNDLDIAPVEVSFLVKYNTDPPEEGGIILVDFDKESFIPGDTATTNCKWLTAYNELLDFPALQSFNVEITGGSEFGMLFDPNTGTVSDNLQGVSNGFKVITATSIPYDSVVIRLKVITTVEVNSPSRSISNQNPKSEIRENNITDNDNGTQTITPDLLIIGGEEIVGFGDVIVKADSCDEEIKKCTSNQPQTFNPLWIEKSKNYSHFDPNPSDPNSMDFIVTGCQLKRNSNVQGITFIIPGMPLGKTWNQNYSWRPQENAIINLCFLENENRWLIRFEELRIPIFCSDCIEGYTDLGDGLNTILLISNITSMKDYNDVINDLKYWWTGPYSQEGKAPRKYAFSNGILKHEFNHFIIDSSYIITSFNNFFSKLYSDSYWLLDKNTYPCPTDALSAKKSEIKRYTGLEVEQCFNRYSNLSKADQKQEELNCDQFARVEYDSIKVRINRWVVNQTWFKP